MEDFEDRIRVELDRWADAGLTARVWWRDDDAISDTTDLRRLLGGFRAAGIVPAIGVVPERADGSLAALLSTTQCAVWQHGWGHHRYGEQEIAEFADGRPLDLLIEDAVAGQSALDGLFGPRGWQRVFVPPFHLLSVPFKRWIPRLGYDGVSAGVPLTPRLDAVVEVNAEIDVMDWHDERIVGDDAFARMVCQQLALRRRSDESVSDPIGILTHHLAFDENAWAFVSRIIVFLADHPAVRFVPADTLFDTVRLATADRLTQTVTTTVNSDECADVTVAITSCGRQDLLARTIDSFLKYNTCLIREIVVMEDGGPGANAALEDRYGRDNVRFLSTGARVGQIASIDRLYQQIATRLIFHCEDDWEFYASGFMERSLCVLNDNPHILQVQLRALNDTNNHPVMSDVYFSGEVPYRVMQPGHQAPGLVWNGFSFNPGLRRRSDYLQLGRFGSFDPANGRASYEVESEVSTFFLQRGLLAAILADNGGRGYVRHIGWERTVGEPGDEPGFKNWSPSDQLGS